MIMRLRRPDRKSFSSPMRERLRKQREHYYASATVVVVKIVLFVFLCILFSVSLRLFHNKFSHVTPAGRYAIPAVVAIFALIFAYNIYNTIKQLSSSLKERHKNS